VIKVHLSRIMGEKRITVAELSRMTGLHRNGISKLYNEETDGVKFETLDKICDVLECSVADLIEYQREYVRDDRGYIKLTPTERGQEMMDRVKSRENKDRAE
jgi:putative transcriptional regulator